MCRYSSVVLPLLDAIRLSGDASQSVRRIVVPDDEYRADIVARGVPEARAVMLLGLFRASRDGEFSNALSLGRRPILKEKASLAGWPLNLLL